MVEGTLEGDRLTDARILTPSPDRVSPPCAHARTCGGCLMQHASDPFVADWKQGIVEGALAGQGLTAPFRPILTSPPRSRRRATLRRAAHQRRRADRLSRPRVGYLVAVPDASFCTPTCIATFPALEALVVTGGSRVRRTVA